VATAAGAVVVVEPGAVAVASNCMPAKVPVMNEASVLGKMLVRVPVPFGALEERVTIGIVAIIMAVLSIDQYC